MTNPYRVTELLGNLISERLSLHDHDTVDSTCDEEIAKHLCNHIESILESTHTTLSKLNILLISTIILISNNLKKDK